jgi:NodT family efflux transporter outer membrane factor (OMF) lipoprotein
MARLSTRLRATASAALMGALMGALTAALGGCTVGPDFKRPADPTVSSYRMKGEAPAPASPRLLEGQAPAGRWWTAFGSPELDAVVDQALAGSPSLSEADATLAQVRAEAGVVRGNAGPQVDANAGLQRERANFASFGLTLPGINDPTFWLYSVGTSVGYDLDLAGGNRRAIESAGARAEAEGWRADAAYMTLTSKVVLESIAIASLRAQIDALEQSLQDDRDTVEITRKAIAAGGAAPATQVSAVTQLAEDSALLPPLRQELDEARHRLALLVGRAPAEWSPPDFDLAKLSAPAEIPLSLPSQLVHDRPDIRAAEADVHADVAAIGVQTARLYPDVRLAAGIEQGALSPGQILNYNFSGWNLGPQLTVPIFNAGALKAGQRAAQAAAQASLARYKDVVLEAFVQVADVLQALAHDEEELKAETMAVESATANLRDQRLAFREGGGTLLEMIDAQRQLNRTRRELAAAEGQRYLDTARLFAATASDWRRAPEK